MRKVKPPRPMRSYSVVFTHTPTGDTTFGWVVTDDPPDQLLNSAPPHEDVRISGLIDLGLANAAVLEAYETGVERER